MSSNHPGFTIPNNHPGLSNHRLIDRQIRQQKGLQKFLISINSPMNTLSVQYNLTNIERSSQSQEIHRFE
uniref:Uncharacterized protein n=1 Tax=Onchocerca volvulus TaxID=6282 RepID=A0A8R1XZM1_ONCVO